MNRQIVTNFPFVSNEQGQQVFYGDPMGPGTFTGSFVGDFSGSINGLIFNTASIVYGIVNASNAIHGVPITMSNPFSVATTPVGFVPQAAISGTASSSLIVNYVAFSSSTSLNKLYLTPYFDLQDTRQYASIRKTSNQSHANNVTTTCSFDTPVEQVGTDISIVQSGRITVATPGVYEFFGNVCWDASNSGLRAMYWTKNGLDGAAGRRKGEVQYTVSSSVAAGGVTNLQSSAIFLLSGGDYVNLNVFQNSGGALNLQGNTVDECNIQINKLSSAVIPTGSLTGLLIGNQVGTIGSVNINQQVGNYSGSFTGSFNGQFTGTFTGSLFGLRNGSLPFTGTVGECFNVILPSANAVVLTSTLQSTIVTASLTAGNWLVSGMVSYLAAPITGTRLITCINTGSNGLSAIGDWRADTPTVPTVNSTQTMDIASALVQLTASQIVFLSARGDFTVGALSASGRLTCVRFS